MSIFYPDNTASRTALPASGITTDNNLTFNINYAASERSLSLEQLKNTGLKVYNVKQYGAVGDGVSDDTAEIQAAIDACNTAGGGVVYLPNGNYKTSATLNLKGAGGICQTKLAGDKNFLAGTVIKPTMTDGTACIQIDALQYWHIENITISHNSDSISNYIGINAINVAARWCLENVHVRLAAKGYFINGWIANAKNVWATYCTVGFEGDTINGGVMDLNIEVCPTGLVLDTCQGLTIHTVIEGSNTCVQAIVLDACNDILFDSMYLEFTSTALSDAIDIGGTSGCSRIKFNGGFLYSASNATGYLVRVANSTDIEFDRTWISSALNHRGMGIIVESTSSRFRWNGVLSGAMLQDNSSSSPYTVNLMSNSYLEYYLDELGYNYTTSATESKESLQVTPIIKTGKEAIRITVSSSGISNSRLALIPNTRLFNYIKGKTVTLGAWIYVPAHASFTIPDYPAATTLLPGVITIYDNVGSTSSNTTGLCQPSGWNFVTVTHSVAAAATDIQFFIGCINRIEGSSVSTGTEYVVLDSLYLCEGTLTAGDLLQSQPMRWLDEIYANGSWTGAVTLQWVRAYTQTATLTGNVTSISQTLPYNQKALRLAVTQSGSGGYTISFPATWSFSSGITLQPATGVATTSVYDLWYDGTNVNVVSVKR